MHRSDGGKGQRGRNHEGPHQRQIAHGSPSTRTLMSPMAEPGPAAESAENAFAANLFEGLPRRYDRMAEVLSLRQNGRWRRELVRHIVRFKPTRILDVATGTAGVAIALARATEADIVGVDISEPMLERGKQRVYDAGLDQRIHLEKARAEELPFPDASFDAVSFTYLLRYVADPAATLVELARVLRPHGGMAGLDFFVPPNPVWRAGWRLYTRGLMPAAGRVLAGPTWWRVGRFLGPNIEEFYRRWPMHRLFEAWREAGIVDVEDRVMSLGGGLVMWGRKHHA
ncbi:MAG: methyltransferase domain-containing protein [Chloroflexi bacterium]|nr:MAG: methyltransferase domain-containing protein [Chloroflexota bacterium]